MAPFLPVIGISRSQSIRIGRSPNAVVVPQLSMGDTPGVNPHTGALNVPVYVDLGDPQHRRDLEHHSAIGELITVGNISQTVTSDVFATGQPTVTAGTGVLNVAVGNFTLKSRTYGNTLAVTGKTLTLAPNAVAQPRNDLVVVDNAGNLSVVQGVASSGHPNPAVPANKTLVAVVVVPASATSTTSPTSATASAPTS